VVPLRLLPVLARALQRRQAPQRAEAVVQPLAQRQVVVALRPPQARASR
jgi:hypothetical protein